MCSRKFVLSFCLALLALSWAHSEPSSTTEGTPIPMSPQLKQRLEEARSITLSLLQNQDKRDTLTQATEQRLQQREAALSERERQLDKKASDLNQREQTLKAREDSRQTIDQASADLSGSLTNASTDLSKAVRPSGKAALWRGLALSAIGGLVGSLADRSTLQGAELGAAAGAAVGVGWGVVEIWPRKVIP